MTNYASTTLLPTDWELEMTFFGSSSELPEPLWSTGTTSLLGALIMAYSKPRWTTFGIGPRNCDRKRAELSGSRTHDLIMQ
eukprot:3278100-Rhodomonas_salina.1